MGYGGLVGAPSKVEGPLQVATASRVRPTVTTLLDAPVAAVLSMVEIEAPRAVVSPQIPKRQAIAEIGALGATALTISKYETLTRPLLATALILADTAVADAVSISVVVPVVAWLDGPRDLMLTSFGLA